MKYNVNEKIRATMFSMEMSESGTGLITSSRNVGTSYGAIHWSRMVTSL